ncbi:MAG: PAS domain S-box protein [Candidatus Magnetoovum sp. WYHC-5]|nr:PAS domain S-box protein [Candidatus Magnetoovum sp. WYHC-5]
MLDFSKKIKDANSALITGQLSAQDNGFHNSMTLFAGLRVIFQEINQLEDGEKQLQRLIEFFCLELKAKGCLIRLKDCTGAITIVSAVGLSEDEIYMLGQKSGNLVPLKVFESGKVVAVENLSLSANEYAHKGLLMKSMVCVPIKSAGRVIGTIELYDKFNIVDGSTTVFTAEDGNNCETMVIIFSMAIERALLYIENNKIKKTSQRTSKRIDIFFNNVRSAILIIKKDLTIVSANKAIENWIDINYLSLVGKNASEVFKEGNKCLCPQSVAVQTFETGKSAINNLVIKGRYAEITSYPIFDTDKAGASVINECIVMIRDTTDRILCQNEVMELYKSVTQTKDRLESLIQNSADAIITTTLDGNVLTWNKSAERIFGFTAEEAVSSYLPFLPNDFIDKHNKYVQIIKKGETLKEIETKGLRKDLTLVPMSLTVSPITDKNGIISSVSIIARDISRRKQVEDELTKNSQRLSRLFIIGSAMRGTLEINKLLRMVLTVVTATDGFGFNRAILFFYDDDKKALKGTMGVGPASYEEAWHMWRQMPLPSKTLSERIYDIEKDITEGLLNLDEYFINIEIPIDRQCYLTRAVKDRKAFNIKDATTEVELEPLYIDQLATRAYAVVPMISRNEVIGVLWIDNKFNMQPITNEDMGYLSMFADYVATAVESARLFEKAKLTEKELENIFESINDLLFITDNKYNIVKINRAVSEMLNEPISSIIGQKCYKVFHGLDAPSPKCPHFSTMEKEKPVIKEYEGFHHKSNDTYSISTSPLLDLNGKCIGVVHIGSNIMELTRLRKQLSKIEKVAALGEMAARLAHEIRNPLVSIGGFARRLEKKLSPPLNDYARIILEEVFRLEALLKQTIGFVRETKIGKDTVDLNALLLSVIQSIQHTIRKDVSIDYHLSTQTLEVEGDPGRLTDVFVNLINNAEQAIEGTGRIIIRTRKEFNHAVVEVEDTGSGIDEQTMESIFEPFYTTKTTGSGLGLTIIQKILEEHKGIITVKSKQGVGTIFKVNLNLKEVISQ